MKNIGISVLLAKQEYSVWENGVRQTVIYLAQALQAIGGYQVFLVNVDPSVAVSDQVPWDLKQFKTVQYNEVRDSLDVMLVMGSTLSPAQGHYLKRRGTKIAYYPCGNRYVIDMETILFKGGGGTREDESFIDEVWLIPQHESTNVHYLETLYRAPVRVVPFVWSPLFIDQLVAQLPNQGRYVPKSGAQRVSCFEPNINVVKYCMYDILIVEKAYRSHPELFSALFVTNTDGIKKSALLTSLLKTLDVVKKGIASFESRYRMPIFLSKYTDIVVAHQWENPLNNAYLETLYLQYPLVHNSPLIKDAGYYFEGFDAEKGAQQLLLAAQSHTQNQEAYEERSRATIARYSSHNPANQHAYDQLLRGLIEKPKAP